MWPAWFKSIHFRSSAHRPDHAWRWLPSRCAVCKNWPEPPLCDACVSGFAQPLVRCQACALPLPHRTLERASVFRCGECLKNPPPLDICLSATTYAWPWVDLIANFKFHQQVGWAGPLASLMLSTPLAEDTLDAADWVLPMPLSSQRLAERGYNQSWLLAQALSPHKSDATMLMRTRDTPSQRNLSRQDRLTNLVNAMAVDPLRAHELRGRRVVLVDDVMTSGASVFTAARVLRAAGASHIGALVLARTASP